MKRIFLTAIACLAFVGMSFGQLFNEEASFYHIGLGVGSPYVYSGSSLTVPPIHGSFEIAVSDRIGVGGLIGYTASREKFGIGSRDWSYFILGARGAYHFLEHEHFDAYGGLMLAYNIASSRFNLTDSNAKEPTAPTASGIFLGAFVGGRYQFNKKLGAFAELGYNISWLSVGLSYRP
ncbi:MAG: hypothetical protein ACKOQY_06250 [Bacteroidota bacterium]